MSLPTIVWSPQAAKFIESIKNKAERCEIENEIASLSFDPHPRGSLKVTNAALRHHEGETYRVRIGKRRIVYATIEVREEIYIVRLGDRDDVYKVQR